MYGLLMIFSMIFLHVIDDFNQGIMAELKQKKNWELPDLDRKNIYKSDWIPVLLLHGFKWSVSVHIPIILYHVFHNNIIFNISNKTIAQDICDRLILEVLIYSIVISGLVHSVIDHLKCNEYKINLVTDQLLHLIQIIIIFIINYLFF